MGGQDQFAQAEAFPSGTLDGVAGPTAQTRLPGAEGGEAGPARHPNALYAQGVAALRDGNAEAAVDLVNQAIALRRGQPLYHYVLGQAFRALGDSEAAIDAFEKCIRLRPDFAQAKLLLGLMRIGQGNHVNGLRLCRQALRQNFQVRLRRFQMIPANCMAWVTAWVLHFLDERGAVESHGHARLGHVAETHGDPEGAVVEYRKALYHDPDNFEALCGLGRALEGLGYTREAIPQFEKAVALRLSDPGPLAALSELLGRQGRTDEAVALAERAISLAPNRPDALLAKAWARYRDGDADTAIECFQEVLKQRPKTASALRGLGRCFVDLGRVDDASLKYKEAITVDPDHAEALRDLAMVRIYFADHPLHKQVAAAHAHDHHSTPARMRLNYALAKLRDDIGAVDEAFEHFVLANELTDSVFDPAAHAKYIAATTQAFDGPFFNAHEGWGDPSEVPVFIVGMPRSGTTLVEHVIAGHPDAFGTGERTDIARIAEDIPRVLKSDAGYPECVPEIDRYVVQMGAARYLERLQSIAPDAKVVIDRTPMNFLHLGLIALMFPNARIIHCVRDPLDVCMAIYLCPYLESLTFAHDLTNIGKYYREYEHLMAHWRQTLNLRIHEVRYEDMVVDPEAASRKILEFCGLPWDSRCLKTNKTERVVRSVSSVEVRRQIYTEAVGRWKRYERHVAPLKQALGLAD